MNRLLSTCALSAVLLCTLPQYASAQSGFDTTRTYKIGDATTSVRITDAKKKPFQPDPKRAGLFSAIVPGLGQAYNRQYWKVPVIYAGLAVAGYFINDNYTNYQAYRKAYIGRINNPYPSDKYVGLYTTDQLQQLQNDYSKFLNLSVMFTGIGYTLQIVEAITGAHLKNFDISRDISMQLQPVSTPMGPALGMVVNF